MKAVNCIYLFANYENKKQENLGNFINFPPQLSFKTGKYTLMYIRVQNSVKQVNFAGTLFCKLGTIAIFTGN